MNAIAFPSEGLTDTPSSGFPLRLVPTGDFGSVAASVPCLASSGVAGSRDVPGEGATPCIHLESDADIVARDALLDRAMGPGRRRKSSEKLRRGRIPSDGLAFVARAAAGSVVGTVRLWDVTIADSGTRALLLGPLAVDPAVKSAGIGSSLMRHAISEAARLGHRAILLVGDAPYYGRFGFAAAKTGDMAMPGPYERHRFLALELTEGALDGARGVLKAAGRRQSAVMARAA